MTTTEIRAEVLRAIAALAPEIDPASLEPGVSLRDQVDLDSMDLLNLMAALHERFRIDIPEADYPQLMTVNGAVGYLTRKGAVAVGLPHSANLRPE